MTNTESTGARVIVRNAAGSTVWGHYVPAGEDPAVWAARAVRGLTPGHTAEAVSAAGAQVALCYAPESDG